MERLEAHPQEASFQGKYFGPNASSRCLYAISAAALCSSPSLATETAYLQNNKDETALYCVIDFIGRSSAGIDSGGTRNDTNYR
jgi:hypothetical protein